MDRTFPGSHRVTTAAVAASLVAVAMLAVALRGVHARVLEDHVRRHTQDADALASGGDLEAAAVQYRAALQLERGDPAVARSLALTLLRLGRLDESESYLQHLLRGDPTDGALNRGLARIHVERGRAAEARATYQRAIYGQWPGEGQEERVATRFEFIEYLTRSAAPAEVLAELLRLRVELPAGRTAEARRTAQLFAEHGAADLALQTLAAAAVASPRDVDLLAQLSQQQLSAGRTGEARATLQRAIALEPRKGLQAQLAVIDRVLALDPALPRLGMVARTRRARLLLSAVVARTSKCAPALPEVTRLRQEAARGGRRAADAARAERELTLAADLWSAAAACHGEDVESRAIAEILERLGTVSAQR